MEKEKTDYSNTIIYKIFCKDSNVKDIYVGHTTDFIRRKKEHRAAACNMDESVNKCKLYDTIIKNNGWDNWHMEIIHFFNCNNLNEAKQKEQEYFELLGANLNSVEPYPSSKNIKKAIPKPKIVKNTEAICNNSDHTGKLGNVYFCKICDITTLYKTHYEKHLLTSKHLKKIKYFNKTGEIMNGYKYECICGKIYNHRQSLSDHKKKCSYTENMNTITDENNSCINNITEKELMIQILKQNQTIILENQEFKTMLMELVSKPN